jgi:uncharacterized membrane protein
MPLTPLIAVHTTAALLAIATGPVALWARKGRAQRPKLHRAFGYAWVTLMIVTAVSAIFISGDQGAYLAALGLKFSWIHVLIPVTFGFLFIAFRHLIKGNITGHKQSMQNLYVGACVVAGGFTLLPNRLLGDLIFHQWFGLGLVA